MKTATKVILIIVLVLVVLGALTCGAAHVLGARFSDLAFERVVPEEYSAQFDAEGVRSLSLEISAGEFFVERGTGFSVSASGVDTSGFSASVTSDGTLKVSDGGRGSRGFWALRAGHEPRVTITLPKDFRADSLELRISAGALTLCDLQADSFLLDMSAGAANAGAVTARRAAIDVSAGAALIDAVTADSLELDISAGALNVSDILCPEVSLDCSAGKALLSFLGAEEDYRIELSATFGSVDIDGRHYTADRFTLGSPKAEAVIDLNVSAGEAELNFA